MSRKACATMKEYFDTSCNARYENTYTTVICEFNMLQRLQLSRQDSIPYMCRVVL
jgi:hypothetical protein